MAHAELIARMSYAEYLERERTSASKHEYLRGEVFAMAGGSMRHNALCIRLGRVLDTQLQGRCVVLSSDQRVVAANRERYVYPDLSVVCGPVRLEPGTSDVLANPTILLEVLSSSTEQYDRGLKWEGYQSIESLTDYVLISQTGPRIEHYRRDRTRTWVYQFATAGERLVLPNDAVLDIDAIFAGMFELAGDG